EDGERGETQKVEFHEAGRLDVVLVVLADDALRAVLRVERREVGELSGSNQDAARMHADVTRQSLNGLGELEQLAHLFLALLALGQQRLLAPGIGDRDELAGLEGNELGDAIDKIE